jgi:hypothetical protein
LWPAIQSGRAAWLPRRPMRRPTSPHSPGRRRCRTGRGGGRRPRDTARRMAVRVGSMLRRPGGPACRRPRARRRPACRGPCRARGPPPRGSRLGGSNSALTWSRASASVRSNSRRAQRAAGPGGDGLGDPTYGLGQAAVVGGGGQTLRAACSTCAQEGARRPPGGHRIRTARVTAESPGWPMCNKIRWLTRTRLGPPVAAPTDQARTCQAGPVTPS